MSGWLIAGGVVLLLVLLLLTPLRVDTSYQDDLLLKIYAGLIGVRILPQKKKTEKKMPQKPAAPKEKQKHAFSGDPKQLIAVLREFLPILSTLKRKLVIRTLMLRVVFGGDDPAASAVGYGYAWGVIGTLTPLFEQNFDVRERDVEPVFDPRQSGLGVRFHIVISISLGALLYIGILALTKFLQLQKKGEMNK